MAILTIANLLDAFRQAETEILNQQDIKHPTTIGTMYEGLTAEIVDRSIFQGLNLVVARNSFIKGCHKEFDVILAEGEGERIRYTDRYTFLPEQVIAIIQVRKNLYSKDIREGYEDLQFLSSYYNDENIPARIRRLARDAYRGIAVKEIPFINSETASLDEDLLWDTLLTEAILPARIVWGYNGFVSERNFRDSFYEFLKENVSSPEKMIGGFGPHNFPSLVICSKYTLLKQNGMPFICRVQQDNWWPFLSTSSYNSTYLFLETIWTRLAYRFDLSLDFGEDLNMEPATRFIDCRAKIVEGMTGWEFNYITVGDESLSENIEVIEWSPAFIDTIQFSVFNVLLQKNEIDLSTDTQIGELACNNGYSSLSELVDSLKSTNLVYTEGSKLKLVTDRCQCCFLPDGKIVAGENKSGRLTSWVDKYVESLNTKSGQ